MSDVYELQSRSQCRKEASLWIARLDRRLSDEEKTALQQWMAADPRNEGSLLEMASLWDRMGTLSRLTELFPEPVCRPGKSLRFAVTIAASVLVVILAAGWLALEHVSAGFGPRNGPLVTTASNGVYQTAIGERSRMTLTDGTELVLNTNTLVEIKFTAHHRVIILEQGELHVLVAKDTSRALSVVAAGNVVQAVGTEFNIEIKDNRRMELVVTEGKVRVGVYKGSPEDPNSDRENAVLSLVMPPSSVTVAAGEAIILGSPDEVVMELSPADIAVQLSWRDGNLIFRGESLEEAVNEIARYTRVEFVFMDDELKRIRIAGLFKTGDVDGLLEMLRENFNITYQQVNENKILLSAQ